MASNFLFKEDTRMEGRVIWMLPTDPPRDMSRQAWKTDVIYYLKIKSIIAGETGHITSNLNVL